MTGAYFSIADPDLISKIQDQVSEANGCYFLHWFEDDNPKSISRLIGSDKEGILYIGSADVPLYNRIHSLQQSILANFDHNQTKPKLKGHKALSQKFFRIRKHVRVTDLFVTVKTSNSGKSPGKAESFYLDKYASINGELPPLNGNYGKYPHWELFI